MKIKKMCGIKKEDMDSHLKDIIEVIKKPKYICKKCARVSNDKELLCKASKIKK